MLADLKYVRGCFQQTGLEVVTYTPYRSFHGKNTNYDVNVDIVQALGAIYNEPILCYDCASKQCWLG
jgi:hypothetical protein